MSNTKDIYVRYDVEIDFEVPPFIQDCIDYCEEVGKKKLPYYDDTADELWVVCKNACADKLITSYQFNKLMERYNNSDY